MSEEQYAQALADLDEAERQLSVQP
jgi:hypothetical protein